MQIDMPITSEAARCETGRSVLRQVELFCAFLLVTVFAAACAHHEHSTRTQATASSAAPAKTACTIRKSAKSGVVEASARRGEKLVAVRAVDTTSTAAAAADEQAVHRTASRIAADLAQSCPAAAPGDQVAFDACRKALFGQSALRQSLSDITLWGRQNKDPAKSLKETGLTQFGPDVFAGLYIPLFMFNGQHAVAWSENEKLWRVELAASFRNRLQPGQFPYPFWHEDEKWQAYEKTNAILLWIDPTTTRIKIAQFTARGAGDRVVRLDRRDVGPFDGKWMWTDSSGAAQPKVTLFDGLFRADNPHLAKLDDSYRQLALSLREGQCMGCHVPSNPAKMKRLVLLQTPAHAAAEIQRVMTAVRKDRMPLDEQTGIETPMDAEKKERLLARAAEFEAAVAAAKRWDSGRGTPHTGPPAADAGPQATSNN